MLDCRMCDLKFDGKLFLHFVFRSIEIHTRIATNFNTYENEKSSEAR